MGFFSGSSTQTQTSVYDNPELRQYTAQYRDTAPWTFASLDPTATLASMRQSPDSAGTKKLGGVGGEFGKELKKQADAENMEREASNAALKRIQKRQESGSFLTTKETEFINTSLDKAFEYAHKTGYEDWTKATQMMAGRRGMRMDDTPVSDPAMKELRNFEVGLGSKRAELGLGATLEFSKNQQDFDANFSSMLKQLGQNRWATRQGFMFGGGLHGAGNLGYTNKQTNQTTQNMSGFQKLMSGFQIVNAGLDLGKKIGGMAMGAGAMGGGASSASGPMSMLGGGGATGYGSGFSYQ